MKRLFRSVVDILLGKISLKLLGIIFTPILVRLLTKQQYGEFVGILIIFQIIERVSNMGLSQSVTKHTASVDQGRRTDVLSSALGLAVIYSAITAVSIYIAESYTQLNLFSSSLIAYIAISVVILRNPFEVLRGYLYGLRQERTAQIVIFLRKAVYTVFGLGAAYAGLGIVGLFTGYAVSFLIGCLFIFLIVYKIGWGKITISPTKETTKQVARYGAVNLVGFMAALLLYKVDILLIRFFVGDTATAGYQAAIFPAELIWVVPGAIQGALLQDVAAKWGNGDTSEVTEALRSSIKYGFLSILLFSGGLFALAEDFLLVYYGADFLESATALRILLLGTVVYGLNKLYIPVLQGIGQLRWQQATNVAALVVNVILNLILIPKFGALGAAVGTSISYSSIIIGSFLILRRTAIRQPDIELWGRLGLLTVGFILVFVIPASLVSLPSFLSLTILPPIGLTIFILLSHMFGIVNISHLISTAKTQM